jgi:hypothetical protein
MRRGTTSDENVSATVEMVDVRTGQRVGVFLDGTRLQVVAPDRINGRGVIVTEFGVDEVVLAGPVSRKVQGRRGAWALTRAVRIDDPEWGSVAPAWSWVFVPDGSEDCRRSGVRFMADLRRALPQRRWSARVKLTKAARKGWSEPSVELLELARRRDAGFAAACAEVAEERARRAAGLAEEAERVLLDSLSWRSSTEATAPAP